MNSYSEKLKGLPTIHYPTLSEYPERQEFMKAQFAKYGITKTKMLLTDRYEKIKDNYTLIDTPNLIGWGHPGNIISYITLLKDWCDNSEEEYAIFCDDDTDLMTVDYWNFSWGQFVDSLPSDWECVHLVRIEERQYGTDLVHGLVENPELKLRMRKWCDWGTAFLIKKSYARKILNRHYVSENTISIDVNEVRGEFIFNFWPLIENVLFRGLGVVYNFPLFVEKASLGSFMGNHLPPEEWTKLRYPHMRSREIYENLWKEIGSTLTLNEIMPTPFEKKPFFWGDVSKEFVNYVSNEIWGHNIYEKIESVREGDVVVDIGASCGAFAYSILDKRPKHIYCFEPSKNFYELLTSNLDYENVSCINKAIVSPIHPKSQCILFWSDGQQNFETVTFKKFLREYNISKIDFLKIDCEGGEYNIFTEENMHFLQNNVRHIVGEFHFVEHQNPYNYKYINFLTNCLSKFKKYKAFSQDGIDITDSILDIESIGYRHGQVMIYISND